MNYDEHRKIFQYVVVSQLKRMIVRKKFNLVTDNFLLSVVCIRIQF